MVNASPLCGSINVESFSQGHNDAISSADTKPRANNLAIVNFRLYPLSCTAAVFAISALRVFSKVAVAQYAKCGLRITTFRLLLGKIINWRSYRLSDAGTIATSSLYLILMRCTKTSFIFA